VAHIPDAHGSPICLVKLKLADWHLSDQMNTSRIICANCKQKQAKATGA
jgi:hypothetical protein